MIRWFLEDLAALVALSLFVYCIVIGCLLVTP
jgi:hypothetical protein